MTGPPLRTATEEDLDEIVGLFLQCWSTAYTGLLPDRTVAAVDHAWASGRWSELLTRGDGCVVTVATDASDGIVGVVRWSRDADEPGRVDSLYVRPTAQGKGLGRRLLEAATEQLAGDGASRAVLWVFEGNGPARLFYAREGWRPTGERRVEPRFGVPELQLGRDLAPEAEW
jgi:GNAT superfamily N-acetyltransferase